jgi:hypothetical protein
VYVYGCSGRVGSGEGLAELDAAEEANDGGVGNSCECFHGLDWEDRVTDGFQSYAMNGGSLALHILFR